VSGEARKDEDPLLEIHTTRSDRNNFKQLYYNTSLNQIWARSVLVVAGVVAVVVVGSSKLVFFSLTTLHFPIFWLTCISRASPPRDIDFEAKGFMCSSRKNQTHFCLQRCMNIHGYGNVPFFLCHFFCAVFLRRLFVRYSRASLSASLLQERRTELVNFWSLGSGLGSPNAGLASIAWVRT